MVSVRYYEGWSLRITEAMMTVVGAGAHNLLLVKDTSFFAVHSLHFCRIRPKSQFADVSLPRCARLEFPCQKALIFGVGLVAGYRWRVHSYESIGKIQVLQSLILLIFYLLCCSLWCEIVVCLSQLLGDKIEIGNQRDEEDRPNLDALLSAFEILCIVPSAIISIGCAVNYTFLGSNKSFQPSFLNKFFAWQCVFLVGAVAISSFIRQRQWRRISKVSYKTGSESFNLVDRIEKLEEDIKSSAKIIRVLTRQVEKLGIRFRVTRKTLKGPITEVLVPWNYYFLKFFSFKL